MGSEQVVSPHGSGSPLLPPSLALNCQQGGSDVGLQVPRWSAEPIFGAVFRCSDRSQPPTTLILVQQHVQSPSGSKCPGNEGLENILVCYYDNLLLCPMLVPDLFFFSCWNGLSFLAAWRKSQQVRFAQGSFFVLLVKILPTSSPSICACSKKSKDLLTLFTLQGVGWEMTVIRGRVVHSHKEQRRILKLHFLSFESRDCLICKLNIENK